MMEILGEWILRITGTAMISMAALALTPEGAVKRVVRLVCGFAAMLALLSVAAGFDGGAFSLNMAEYRAEAARITEDAAEKTSKETRLIIERRCAAYILDKAAELDLRADAEVSAAWSEDGYWYPVSAAIRAAGRPEDMERLKRYVEAELGVAAEDQEWSGYD